MSKPDFRETPYGQRVVAFIDIIGFQELIQSKSLHFIYKTIERLKRCTQERAKLNPSYDWQYSQFSDCVVISYDLKDSSPHPLRELISIINSAIGDMEYKKIMLRGGISIGELFHWENECFGQALIDAYHLESKKAIYPRVILDEKIVEKFGLIKFDIYKYNLDQHLDNLVFVSDIKPRYTEHDYSKQPQISGAVLETLEINKDRILEGLQKVPSKYIWPISYHNFCCEKNCELAPSLRDDFLALKIAC